jgi:hypothetical protein
VEKTGHLRRSTAYEPLKASSTGLLNPTCVAVAVPCAFVYLRVPPTMAKVTPLATPLMEDARRLIMLRNVAGAVVQTGSASRGSAGFDQIP